MKLFSEIHALEKIYHDHKVKIRVSEDDFSFTALGHVWITFTLNNHTFVLLVDDEYKDFSIDNSLLHLCLVLRELETYYEEEDLLAWSKHKYVDPGNSKILDYYRSLSNIYTQVEQILGNIDSHVSYFDFEMNAGAAQFLRKKK